MPEALILTGQEIRPSSGVQTSHGKRRTGGSIQVECCVVKLFDIASKGTLCHDLPASFLSFFLQYAQNLRFVSELAPSGGFSSMLEKTARLDFGRGSAVPPGRTQGNEV